jgi:uncharacterized membrane protein YgdD (TMEM256/DUF423 family)
MPIIRDIPITLQPEEVIASRGQKRIRPALLKDAEEAIALGNTLWEPVAAYDWFDVRAVTGDRVQISSPSQTDIEATLRVGPKADLLEGARRVLVSVGTIGPALEKRVQELQEGGEGLKSYMLDSAGVVGLGAIGEALRCLAEETAAREEWGVGAALSPGSLVGWELAGQRELCALLPLDSIGMRLNGYCVLEPHKSFSVIIGIGPGYSSSHVGSVCKFCALKNSCWRRREEPS